MKEYTFQNKPFSIDPQTLIQRMEHAAKNPKSYHSTREAKKISRKIELARQWTKQTAICSETGIAILLEIPRIPGKHLLYKNPLAEVDNARGMAQQSYKYLFSLDTQILAGILITLADDYSLFRYAPTMSGAQKNAILRTCNKSELINAIQVIEHCVNSSNIQYLPQLSFLLDAGTFKNDFEVRLQQWTTLITEAYAKSNSVDDSDDDDAEDTSMPRMATIIKRNKQVEIRKLKELKQSAKQFKADMKQALQYTKDLRKAGVLSVKQKTILTGICDINVFPTIPVETINSIADKLEMMETEFHADACKTLAKLLKRNVGKQTLDSEFLTVGDSDGESVESSEQAEEQPEDTPINSETEMLIEFKGKMLIVNKDHYNSLSPMKQIQYKIALHSNVIGESK